MQQATPEEVQLAKLIKLASFLTTGFWLLIATTFIYAYWFNNETLTNYWLMVTTPVSVLGLIVQRRVMTLKRALGWYE